MTHFKNFTQHLKQCQRYGPQLLNALEKEKPMT